MNDRYKSALIGHGFGLAVHDLEDYHASFCDFVMLLFNYNARIKDP